MDELQYRGEMGFRSLHSTAKCELTVGGGEGSVDGKFLRGNARDREFWQTSEDSCWRQARVIPMSLPMGERV